MSDIPAPLPGEITLPPGQKLLKSGAIVDESTNKIVGNIGGKYTINSTSAYDMHALRQARILQAQAAARGGMAAAAASAGRNKSSLAAVSMIAENMTTYAGTERSIGAVKAAEVVLKMAGMAEDKHSSGDPPAAGAVITLSNDALERLAGLLMDRVDDNR